ncbi:helix-turn-helix transcriptional regulator [Micromonospora sp. DSM 115977]|uniref:Helix-turn-helix transcriptional regulator n=1 Tax=Micromonospora reichwaldensis TaxID=3075516 RepID=A0ABU2WZJ5_9ACTN|nr:helix-turn-helix transcriptional regulator [Micromonospora sp. DSM 115977]MDT0531361.1 helix-turn-helix transcriptional regulator [Micromonospora sp. DSM 115977]
MSTNTNNAGREGPGSETGSPHLTELVRQLKLTYRQAGNPSYRTIIRTTSIGLSTSTISRIFTARKPPKWENLTELLLALGVSREDIKTTWHRLWMLADNEANPLTGTDNAGGELLPAGRRPKDVEVCHRCGAWIADTAMHTRWHAGVARVEMPPNEQKPVNVARRRR